MTTKIKYIIFTVLSLFVLNHGFSQWSDDFSDGDFTSNPTWSGDDVNFEVLTNVLHLNAPSVTDESYLSVSSEAIENATWEFYVELDFNPSSGNKAYVYLVSDQADLKNALNGYFVMIGNTDDEVSLYRQDGTTETKIIDGIDATVDAAIVNVSIQVTRDNLGNWELLIDNTGGTTYTSQGTVFDDTYFQSFYAGVRCDYTSTRSDKFYFDNFNVTGTPFVDAVAPIAQNVIVQDASNLKVVFDEALDITTAENITNYNINQSIGNPNSATLIASDTVLLNLSNSLTNGTNYELTVSNVEDVSGNSVVTTILPFQYIIPSPVSLGDVIINEIYADPSPSYGLPDVEYVELYNNTNLYFEAQNWTFDDGGSSATFPSQIIAPNSYYIIGPVGISDSFPSINTIELSSFPALNNGGDPLALKDENGNLIDAVTYELSWYQDAVKDDGGYSLELINPTDPCSGSNNWSASNAVIGGTPGIENSIFDLTPDAIAPSVEDIFVINNSTIEVFFTEAVDSMSIVSANHIFDPTLTIQNLVIPIEKSESFTITFQSAIDSGVVYNYTVENIQDCWNNNGSGSGIFALPQQASPNDVVINEVLFDPYTGSQDFVEIYNRSDKVLSLENWYLANYDDDTIDNWKPIIEQQKLFLPQTYWALSTDTLNIQMEYPMSRIGRFIEMGSLPTYSNDSATVYLLSSDSIIIDKFSYDADMHFKLLENEDGKSLERIAFDIPSDERTNWHTAAEEVGFATPGYENSQTGQPISSGVVSVSPEIFSPDNDGYDDNLFISYEMDAPGYVATIQLYDATGRPVKLLKNNELLGRKGTFTWDGLNENNEKARSGHYIILFSWFSADGKKEQKKLTCVLAHRRN